MFLSPIIRSVLVSLRTPEQVGQLDSPQWPATHAEFDYQGKTYDVYDVPINGTVEGLALVKKGRDSSQFVDPANAAAGLITWQGSWRSLSRSWSLAPQWSNYLDVWNQINYPRLLFNTAAIALDHDGRDDRVVHARRVRLRAVPVPGPEPDVHAPHRDDLPALRRHDHPDLHGLPEDRLGRARGCRCSCPRSSRTPTTCSCCGSSC